MPELSLAFTGYPAGQVPSIGGSQRAVTTLLGAGVGGVVAEAPVAQPWGAGSLSPVGRD